MIPTLLALGVVLGLFAHDRASARVAGTIVVAASLAWGILLGTTDDQVSTVVAASALGLGNVAFGAGLTAMIRAIGRRRSTESATR